MNARKFFFFTALLLTLVVGAALAAIAGKQDTTPPTAAAQGASFAAELLPDTMGPQPVETGASGRLAMELSADGQTLSYEIVVAALEDAFMSHLHYGGPEDRYGPIVVWLFPEDGKRREVVEGRFDGMLARGEIRAGELSGPLAGRELSALVNAIQEEMIFADIHTRSHVPGELRGQVKAVNR